MGRSDCNKHMEMIGSVWAHTGCKLVYLPVTSTWNDRLYAMSTGQDGDSKVIAHLSLGIHRVQTEGPGV